MDNKRLTACARSTYSHYWSA